MTARKPTKGKCAFCDRDLAKNGVGKHLTACAKYRELVEKAGSRQASDETLHHLRVEAAGMPHFWLDLEMRGAANLEQLDWYLREIWLECCGHMSCFSVGGWRGPELPKNRRVEDVLTVGTKLTHIYDYGTTSMTLVKCVGLRMGKPTSRHPIALLARNQPPEYECIECGKPASCLCIECVIEHQKWGTLCDEHAETHPHGDYGEPIRLMNSPRTGLCGYTGPAEPPY